MWLYCCHPWFTAASTEAREGSLPSVKERNGGARIQSVCVFPVTENVRWAGLGLDKGLNTSSAQISYEPPPRPQWSLPWMLVRAWTWEQGGKMEGKQKVGCARRSIQCFGQNIHETKGRAVSKKSSKNKLSHKPSCALITLEAIMA